MSRHGQVILSKMIWMIDSYEQSHANLRQLVDDLGSMYQSLEQGEQPVEREWRDAFQPLDELLCDRSVNDYERIRTQIEKNLASLRRLLAGCQQREATQVAG